MCKLVFRWARLRSRALLTLNHCNLFLRIFLSVQVRARLCECMLYVHICVCACMLFVCMSLCVCCLLCVVCCVFGILCKLC